MSIQTEAGKRNEGAMEQLREGHYIQPPVDIFENNNEILLYADLPGVATEGLTLHLENGELSIQGCRVFPSTKAEGNEKECIYHRTFKVPTTVDSTKIDATLKQGVLELHLPKLEALKPRQIHIRSE